jgi:hypothetical protein
VHDSPHPGNHCLAVKLSGEGPREEDLNFMPLSNLTILNSEIPHPQQVWHSQPLSNCLPHHTRCARILLCYLLIPHGLLPHWGHHPNLRTLRNTCNSHLHFYQGFPTEGLRPALMEIVTIWLCSTTFKRVLWTLGSPFFLRIITLCSQIRTCKESVKT